MKCRSKFASGARHCTETNSPDAFPSSVGNICITRGSAGKIAEMEWRHDVDEISDVYKSTLQGTINDRLMAKRRNRFFIEVQQAMLGEVSCYFSSFHPDKTTRSHKKAFVKISKTIR